MGGHLVTIESEEENRFLTRLGAGDNENFYIGLTDKEQEGTWRWSSETPFEYTNWAKGGVDWQVLAPNGGPAENYGVIMGNQKIFSNEQWIANPNPYWHDWNNSATKGIAEIKLGSDFAVTQATATLKVNPENDYTTGGIGIDVIGNPADAITSDNTKLQYGDFSGTGSALNLGGSNPSALALTGDVLTGSIGSDSLMGTSDNDILVGSQTGANAVQQDVLTGGAGHDLFVLGNSKGSFYSSQGFDDVARITDFDPTKDQLQVFGGNAYLTAGINKPDVVGTGVFNDVDRNGVIGAGDDLIAIVSNQNNPVELGRNNFKTV